MTESNVPALSPEEKVRELEADRNRWHDVAMRAGVICHTNGSFSYAIDIYKARAEALGKEVEGLLGSLAPFAAAAEQFMARRNKAADPAHNMAYPSGLTVQDFLDAHTAFFARSLLSQSGEG